MTQNPYDITVINTCSSCAIRLTEEIAESVKNYMESTARTYVNVKFTDSRYLAEFLNATNARLASNIMKSGDIFSVLVYSRNFYKKQRTKLHRGRDNE